MRCYSELALERAAVRALDLGIPLDPESGRFSAGPSEPPAGELSRVLSHAATCHRCRELLAILQAAERNLREELAREGSMPKRRSLTLESIPLGPAGRPGEDGPTEGYALAADADRSGVEGDAAVQTPVLSLASGDGRFLVRIFPSASGQGATAVLMRGDAPETPEGTAQEPQESPASTVSISIGGIEYAFDAKGIARLPEFPAQAITLHLR